MGRLFLLEIDEQETPNYLMCRACNTHIASGEKLVVIVTLEWTGRSRAIFYDAINVLLDEPILYRKIGQLSVPIQGKFARLTIADLHCVKCGDLVGHKYIDLVSGYKQVINGTVYYVQKGMVKLHMEKLLWRKGNETRHADELAAPS